MNRSLSLLAIGVVMACAPEDMPASADVFVADQLAPPQSSLTLTTVGTPQHGETFGWQVTGAQPGQQVIIMAANGGVSNNGGACPPFLGGNCADILPGSLGYQLAGWGNADGSGEVLFTYTPLPDVIPPDTYQFQAYVLNSNNNGNESNPVEATVLAAEESCTDAYEVNDSIAGAANLPASGSIATACDTDIDVFALDVPTGAIVEVTITYNENVGDIDMDLVDVNGALLDASGSQTGTDYVLWQNFGPTETVYVRTFSLEELPEDGVDYTITWEIVVPAVCNDDLNEDDDTPGSAQAAVANGALYAGQSCLGDEDWYTVSVASGDTLTAAIIDDLAEGDVRVAIFNASGNTQLTGAGKGARYTASSNTTLAVRVTLQSDDGAGGGAPYELSLTTAGPQACPTDAFEQNDSSGAAAPIDPGVHTGLGGCFNDADWYAVDIDASVESVVYLSLLFDGDDADLDVEIYNPSGQRVADGQSANSNENISAFTNGVSGTYLIHVYVWSGSSDGAPTTNGAVYDMVLYTN